MVGASTAQQWQGVVALHHFMFAIIKPSTELIFPFCVKTQSKIPISQEQTMAPIIVIEHWWEKVFMLFLEASWNMMSQNRE